MADQQRLLPRLPHLAGCMCHFPVQFGIPLERRVGTSYEDAVFKDEVDPEATEWWFTEPAGELCGGGFSRQ